MTIALVLHPFGEKEISGLGRASYALARALIMQFPQHEFLVLAKGAPAAQDAFPGTNWRAYSADGHFWLDRVCQQALRADAYVFFTPIMPIFFRPKRAVVFAHDFAYARLHESGVLRRMVLRYMHGRAFRLADAIVAVSEFTKKEVMELFGIEPQKITVIYNGVNDISAVPPEQVDGVMPPYLLYAGVIKDRKNVLDIVRGFALFMRESAADVRLVLAGKNTSAYAQEVAEEIARFGMQDRIYMTGYVSDAQLSYLYRNALAFVYPTKLEGFGMAILETFSCGLPTIISDTPALKEAAGGAALIAGPGEEGIADAMGQIYRDEDLRTRLAEAGKRRAGEFSWEKSAARLIEVIDA